jgi:FlaA1/EpsC-like NDP-sugar epimerase
MSNFWKDKKVLITGACGTVGSELLKQLVAEGAKEIIGIDNNESELFFIDQKYRAESHIRFYLCDIKNKDQLVRLCQGMNVVIHSAARKHVIINEIAPTEAIYTNIVGTQNVIDAALDSGVERVVFTSSDKAVNPTNVMGTSKLMGERLMTAANAGTRNRLPIFSSTRFGNVLGFLFSSIRLKMEKI